MNPQDSGHKGGVKTKENHYTLCPMCGSVIKSQFYHEVGQVGGQTTLRKYGREFYQTIGRMGGRGNTKMKRATCQS